MQKPICYLDLDDTLIRHTDGTRDNGVAAPGAAEFVRFLKHHFEVRWLTMWCPAGRLSDDAATRLSSILGLAPEELHAIRNPRAFLIGPHCPFKHQAVDLEEAAAGRPFVWVEDDLNAVDRSHLEAHGMLHCHIPCNVSRDPARLAVVRALLAERLGLQPVEAAVPAA